MKHVPAHLLSIDDLSGAEIKSILDRADKIQRQGIIETVGQRLQNRVVALLFFQPSTRTQYGFQSTILRMGGDIMSVNLETSRAGSNWGESLADTARILSGLADLAVIRHESAQGVYEFAAHSDISVINAGNGMGLLAEHPTQALVDLYTIRRVFGALETLKMVIIGGTHLRAFRSQIRALAHFPKIEVSVLCPDKFWMDFADQEQYRAQGIAFRRIGALEEVLGEVDVIYHNGITEFRGEEVDPFYALTAERLKNMRKDAIVLHALPRVEDLHESVDAMPQARYFEQAHNGNFVRAALIEHLLMNVSHG